VTSKSKELLPVVIPTANNPETQPVKKGMYNIYSQQLTRMSKNLKPFVQKSRMVEAGRSKILESVN